MITFQVSVSRRRRRLALRAISPEVVEILSPVPLSDAAARRILAENAAVIDRLLRHAAPVADMQVADGRSFYCRGELYPVKSSRRLITFDAAFWLPDLPDAERRAALEKLYRRLAAAYILPRARQLAQQHDLPLAQAAISGAKRRFGSCSQTRVCRFSWRLIQYPDELIDLVICHELAHLHQMNHSAAFYAELEKLCPGAREKQQKLQKFARLPGLW